MGFTVEDRSASADIDSIGGFALSQEGNPQTHSGTFASAGSKQWMSGTVFRVTLQYFIADKIYKVYLGCCTQEGSENP